MQIAKFPRERFASLPTPLQEMPRLTKKLGGPRLLVKRDDLTGLAMGGNKTRKLEFIIADAKSKGSDVIVTGAGLQSNWSTQTAAAALRCGMKTVICSAGPEGGYKPGEYGGNMLLHYILGADVRVFPVSFKELHEKVFVEVAEELRAKGHTPYVAKFAGSTPIGTLGYVNAMLELLSQATSQGVKIDYVVTACGTGGTQAGLILGAKALDTGIKVVGVAISPTDSIKGISQLVKETAKLLDVDLDLKPEEVTVFNEYIGEGYGAIYRDVIDTIKLVAQTEGIFLDPVYTGKAMTGLIDLVKKGYFTKNDTVVFLHTGGTPALFAYKAPIKSMAESETPPWTKPPWGLW
jgi:D-cysteine desulfhydrase family pyridoxal phosphate-dependent enzyme